MADNHADEPRRPAKRRRRGKKRNLLTALPANLQQEVVLAWQILAQKLVDVETVNACFRKARKTRLALSQILLKKRLISMAQLIQVQRNCRDQSLAQIEQDLVREYRLSYRQGVISFQDVAQPKQIGRYKIIRELGRGGMGIVYACHDASLGRVVALKTMHGGGKSENLLRFLREARLVASLSHPNIVSIHDVGEEAGNPFFTMDYIKGLDLSHYINQTRPPLATKLQIISKIAGALAYAHDQGIIHRDIKPSNILIDAREEPHLTDFGLARAIEDREDQLTISGVALGTPAYMSPEQAAGQMQLVGPRSDQYSLGAVMYEMLVGLPPFSGGTWSAILRANIIQEVVPPRRLVPGLPREVDTICMKAMEKEPTRRYRDMASMQTDIERFLQAQPIQARPAGLFYRLAKWIKRNRALALAIVMVILIVATFGVIKFHDLQELARMARKERALRRRAEKAMQAAQRARQKAEENLRKFIEAEKRRIEAEKRKNDQERLQRLLAEAARWAEEGRDLKVVEQKFAQAVQLASWINSSAMFHRERARIYCYYAERAEGSRQQQIARKGLVCARSTVQLDPSDYMAWFYQYRLYMLLGHFKKARHCIQEIIAINPENEYGYFGRGQQYGRQASETAARVKQRPLYHKALQCYAQAIRYNQKFAPAYDARGMVYMALADYPAAVKDFSKVIQLEPYRAQAYYQRGEAYLKSQSYRQALADYQACVKLKPRYALAYGRMGQVYSYLQDYRQALQAFNQEIALDPYQADEYYQRGRIYAKLANYDQALSDYAQGLWESYVTTGKMSCAPTVLQSLHSVKAIPALRRALHHKDSIVRSLAAEVLGRLKAQEAITDLVGLLKDPGNRVQHAAANALGQIGRPAVPCLLRVLRLANRRSRLGALIALAQMRAKEMIPRLVQLLRDRDATIRQAVVQALGNQHAVQTLPALLGVLHDRDQRVRQAAVQALSKLGPCAVPALMRTWQTTPNSSSVLLALGRLRATEAIPLLIKALQASQEPVRQAASCALVQIGAASVSPLLKVLPRFHGTARRMVISTLGRLHCRAAVPTLLPMLRTASPALAASIATALGEIGDPRSVPLLLQALTSQQPQLQQASAQALGKIKDPRAVPALLHLIQDANCEVRIAGIAALGCIRDQRSLAGLRQALKATAPQIRQAAAQALGKLGNPQAGPLLLSCLRDPDQIVRQYAAKALGCIGRHGQMANITTALLQLLEKQPTEQGSGPSGNIDQGVVVALVAMGNQVIPLLIEALESHSAKLLAQVAQALGELKARRAVPHLLPLLRHPQEKVRCKAAEALGLIADRRALPKLIAALADQAARVRQTSAKSLARMGRTAASALVEALSDTRIQNSRQAYMISEILVTIGAPAVPRLIQALTDRDPKLRTIATRTLTKIGSKAITALIYALQDKQISFVVSKILQKIGPEAIAPLIECLEQEGSQAAAEALYHIGNAAVPHLIQLLSHKQPLVRKLAVETLGKINDQRAVAVLLKVLQDPAEEVRASAIRALGELRAQSAVPLLLRMLPTADNRLAEEVICALGKIQNPRCLKPLLDYYPRRAHHTQRIIKWALRRIGRHALTELITALQHQDSEVRACVARLLGEFQNRRAIPALQKALHDRSRQVRQQAQMALTKIQRK